MTYVLNCQSGDAAYVIEAYTKLAPRAGLPKSEAAPIAAALQLPDREVKDLLGSEKLLSLLELDYVAEKVPLCFRISLLVVHLAAWKEDISALQALQERGFLQQLVEATEAAASNSDWPSGSNSFPLVWKLSISIEQLARRGFATHLLAALRPILQFVCGKQCHENQRNWCIRAVQACIANTDEHVEEMVSDLLEVAAGDDFDGNLLLTELRQDIFKEAAQIVH
eukprot:CAMPEP_0197671688 /NCGR_PEP_ID=MMETSP1338-20131121/77205_1 /TAXON_ID=43686 ORGANISM="Pelagodinium beii, Strain RCC1491" /NCGR_SAMPLE_ID=MMETSP1338 /ASSEMBLY_ACC=CAM_ASM_000754 /LENGTH=223 /DNA_ID=CAMNT_0043251635 /DNA_START=346 /DNA_END=1016 /DNA_ORIENTATION=+